jgi:hypothetical protein
VRLVGFIKKKFVTMHGHINVNFVSAKQGKETY